MEEIGRWFHELLEPNRYAVVMIRDSYQGKKYIPASFHVTTQLEKFFTFKGLKIWHQTGTPVRPYGYPFSYVPNIVHHDIIIFKKEP